MLDLVLFTAYFGFFQKQTNLDLTVYFAETFASSFLFLQSLRCQSRFVPRLGFSGADYPRAILNGEFVVRGETTYWADNFFGDLILRRPLPYFSIFLDQAARSDKHYFIARFHATIRLTCLVWIRSHSLVGSRCNDRTILLKTRSPYEILVHVGKYATSTRKNARGLPMECSVEPP